MGLFAGFYFIPGAFLLVRPGLMVPSGAHDPSACRTVLDHSFAAGSFGRALFSRGHPSASAFFGHMISFVGWVDFSDPFLMGG